LKRLAKLYGMVETLNALQVKGAAAAVFEVERAEAELSARRVQGAAAAREGLARGSRLEALSVEKSCANDEARAALLAKAGAERSVRLEAAVMAHRESRMEARQVDGLVDRVQAAEEWERERRAQGESDDRFLSRREWLRGKGV
jgi:hypothetical protein